MIAVLVVLVVVVLLLRRRAKRKHLLAGLVATRPTFAVAPPARRLSRGSGDRL